MEPITYKSAGVDIAAKSSTLKALKALTRSTFTPRVLSDIGLFGGLYSIKELAAEMEHPVLVSSVDGVGTKLKLAFLTGKHDTVGIDIVSHCVDDILVQGARPLFFMDYIATGKLDPKVIEEIAIGLAAGCRQAGCSLIGGETAEMPGFYPDGEYDLAGFIVGVVDKNKIIDGKSIRPGDIVLGLASSGLHTNGYSLARKILFDVDGYKVTDTIEALGTTVSEALLTPHRCYAPPVFKVLEQGLEIKGMAHLTGGGFYDNIPRILPDNVDVQIQNGSWPVLPIFQLLQKDGNVPFEEMHHVFNMGIGLVLVVSPDKADVIKTVLESSGEKVYQIGKITEGQKKVTVQ